TIDGHPLATRFDHHGGVPGVLSQIVHRGHPTGQMPEDEPVTRSRLEHHHSPWCRSGNCGLVLDDDHVLLLGSYEVGRQQSTVSKAPGATQGRRSLLVSGTHSSFSI